MRRATGAALLGALLMISAAGCSGGSSGESVSVEAVSSVVSAGSLGLADRYAGMVVSGETADVKRDSTKTILETYVKVGDMVQAGDPLFAYDSERMQLDLDKLKLDRENYQNTIASAQQEISELQRQRDEAASGDQLSYTLQIDSRQADIREAEYKMALNDKEIASMETAMENSEIVSPIAGRVMTVDEEGSAYSDPYSYSGDGEQTGDNSVKYITVTDVTRLRVQGNIGELNAAALTEGMQMRIRSRTDETQTWTGTLSLIDWENPVQNTNDGPYVMSSDGGDEMTTASKYPFYIELDSTDGLMMGQHVYIEPDKGEQDQQPTGPVIPAYYIGYEDDGSAYVWAADGKDRLEKRSVTLGMYLESQDAYEIAEGLELTDYIAFPEEGLEEGRPVEKYDPAAQTGDEGAAGPIEVPAGG